MNAPDGIKVLPEDRFSSYRLQVGNIRGLHGHILAPADDGGCLTGDWRAVLALRPVFTRNFRQSNLHCPQPLSVRAALEPEAGEFHFDANKAIGGWTDVGVSVGQRLIAAYRESRHNRD
jgi:hypothetical protein